MLNVRMNKWTNECGNSQCINASNDCYIANSLKIDNCKLIIGAAGGGD